jgi:hypothetical protein
MRPEDVRLAFGLAAHDLATFCVECTPKVRQIK